MNGITIEALHVKNVRLFSELNITFNSRFNFLAGPNRCGKTSVLVCLAHCFSREHFDYSRFSDDAELWADLSAAGKQYRVGVGKGAVKQKGYRKNKIIQWSAPPAANGRTPVTPVDFRQKIKILPLFIPPVGSNTPPLGGGPNW